jgi:hypothetical protein
MKLDNKERVSENQTKVVERMFLESKFLLVDNRRCSDKRDSEIHRKSR